MRVFDEYLRCVRWVVRDEVVDTVVVAAFIIDAAMLEMLAVVYRECLRRSGGRSW
jgi:hypothetical protein